MEATHHWANKRLLVEFLVLELEVVTAGAGSENEGVVRFKHAFGSDHVVDATMGRRAHSLRTDSATT